MNVRHHTDAGHMMRVAAFTVVSCLIASSCSIVHNTAKHSPIVHSTSPDDYSTTAIPKDTHAITEQESTKINAGRTSINTEVSTPEQEERQEPIVNPFATSTADNPFTSAMEEATGASAATTATANSAASAKSSSTSSAKTSASSKSSSKSSSKHSKKDSSKKKEKSSKHSKKDKKSSKHGKAKHSTPKNKSKGHSSASGSHHHKSTKDEYRSSKRHSTSKHSHNASKDHDGSLKGRTATAPKDDASTKSAESTTKAEKNVAPAPVLPTAAIADPDPDAASTEATPAEPADSLPGDSTDAVATEPRTLQNASQERQQKLHKMLTTSTYIAIIALLVAILIAVYLYFKRAMREIRNTQQMANEARAIAKDAQKIAEQKNSTPPTGGHNTPAAAAILDKKEFDALQLRHDRMKQAIDHLQGLITDVRATVGEVIRQMSGHDEDIKQLKAKQAETAQRIEAASEAIEKVEEEILLFKEEISKLSSTHKASSKKASPAVSERDLFAENSPEAKQDAPSSEISDSQPATEATAPAEPAAASVVPTEEVVAAPKSPAAEEPAAPAVEPAKPTVTDSAIDVEVAKKDPVLYANEIAAQHPAFLANLNEKGGSLTKRDRALSTLIALGVERESLQDIFGLTRESLKAARYRIRTKLKLERRDSLDDHLKSWL